MLIRRYFGLLVVGSVVCFVSLAFFDSSNWRSVRFTHPSKTLKRYSKQIGELFSSNSNDVSDDVLLRESEYNLNYMKELVRNLVAGNKTDPVSSQSTTPVVSSDYNDREICKPEENIVFLKTHKTGSSTLTNILNRYADLRNLKVALPTPAFNRFRWPLQFHWSYVDLFLLEHQYANILCNHARYNRPSMDAIMEQDSKYITILRNPVGQFESMFDYMEFSRYFRLNGYPDPMRRFLRRPFHYIRNATRYGGSLPEPMHLIRNGQFFDLGLNPSVFDNRTIILQEIAKLEQDFFLVLIMEYFDESLVLLKREMCWQMDDIVYAKMNQRHREKKETLDSSLKRMIERWNGADVLLYRHFNETFWKKIKMHGKAFYRDLEEFRRKNREVKQSCISPVKAKERAFRLTKEVTKLQINPRVPNFDRYFCEKILTDEVAYLKYFRKKYNPYYGYQKRLRMESEGILQTTSLPDNSQNVHEHDDSSKHSIKLSGKYHSRGNYRPQFVDIPPKHRRFRESVD